MLTPKQNTPYISVFKVQSGDEFIGSVVEETMMAYHIKNPLCMVATQTGFQFAPLIMMADPDKPIVVPKPAITAKPAEKLQEQYEQAVSPIALLKK
jgi:hypothetical protein